MRDTDQFELNRSEAAKLAIRDIVSATRVSMPGDFGPAILVNFTYCPVNDCFFMVLHDGRILQVGKLMYDNKVLNAAAFLALHHSYYDYFIDPAQMDRSKGNLDKFFAVWRHMFELFVFPVLRFLPGDDRVRVLCACNISIAGKKYLIDVQSLYDLQFRFLDVAQSNTFFTMISIENIAVFLQNIRNVSCPILSGIHILYGFRQHDRQEILDACQRQEEKDAAVLRELLFTTTIKLISDKGGNVSYLDDISSFDRLVSKDSRNSLVQILAHFHEDRLFTRSGGYIRMKKIEQLMLNKIEDNSCRDDLSIDAMTCSNFDGLNRLYKLNVKYIVFSHHDISTDLAACMFYELYSGHNAAKIHAPFPYLDGQTYMHEAWSRVMRTFYQAMRVNNRIELPNY